MSTTIEKSKTKRVSVTAARKKIAIENNVIQEQQQTQQQQLTKVHPVEMSPTMERKLVLELRYSLDNDNTRWLAVGIDPKNFDVAIRLTSFKRLHGVQFTIDGFCEVMQLQNMIMEHLTVENNVEYYSFPQGEIYFHKIDSVKTITITNKHFYNGEQQCLGEQAIHQLFNLSNAVQYYAKLLKSLNISSVFYDVVMKAYRISANGGDLNFYIDQLTNVENVLSCLAIKEIMLFYPEKIFDNTIACTVDML